MVPPSMRFECDGSARVKAASEKPFTRDVAWISSDVFASTSIIVFAETCRRLESGNLRGCLVGMRSRWKFGIEDLEAIRVDRPIAETSFLTETVLRERGGLRFVGCERLDRALAGLEFSAGVVHERLEEMHDVVAQCEDLYIVGRSEGTVRSGRLNGLSI